jgi:vitamin B12 transporter
MKAVYLFFPMAVLIAAPAIAQSTPPPTPTVKDTIVVTASATPEQVESTPAAVTVITREEIEQREARDIVDVLREVPGVTVSRTGSQGKITTMFLRGGSSKQTLVLWNGVKINNAYLSGYNFGQLSTAGVEKVEVVRGPYSALYGADAVSGVVNVLTHPTESGLSLDLEGGEHGLLNAVAAGARAADRWNAHAAVEHRQDDGFAPNDDFQSTSILGGAMFLPSSRSSIGVLARHSTYDLGIPRNTNASATAFVPTPNRREDGSESQIAVPMHLQTGRVTLDAHLSESRRSDHFEDPDAPFGAEDAHTDTRTRTALVSAGATTRVGTITLGGEYEQSDADHDDTFGLNVDGRERTARSLFAEDRLSIGLKGGGGIEIAVGLRHDHFDTFGSELSPRLGLAWVRSGHKVRAGYGEAFRAPALGELYLPFFGNPDLQAESSRTMEVGYERYLEHSSLGVTLFRSEYDNLISFGASTFENIAAATAQGVEVSASHRLGRFRSSASYTYNDTEDEASSAPLVRRPRHSGSIALGYDAGATNVTFVLTHAGEREDVTDLFPFGHVTNDAYTTADVIVRYAIGAFAPYVKVENLSNERYEEVFGYPSGARRAIVGLRYTIGRR